MSKNLVIVESPAKAKTIEKFLGKDFTVKSSMGHIRDLPEKKIGVDVAADFEPLYEILPNKKPIIKELQSEIKKAEIVWLATDEDREGEAISWHLLEALKLPVEKTKRIAFHEITKQAILKAIETPRDLDVNLVDAQQARRVLDRLVGFELSPVLWKKIKPALSAGRVQSVAVRLIVEKEKEINKFATSSAYRLYGQFLTGEKDQTPIKAELNKRFATEKEALEFLEKCKAARFSVSAVSKNPVKKSPTAPFTTSSLQQEASRKLGYSVSKTMLVSQQLYEAGLITYMRTDSVNLSDLALGETKKMIENHYGKDYSKTRKYTTKTKGAQEAHEAIRPTDASRMSIDTGDNAQKKLYDLIWKRTIASQMSDAKFEKTTIDISISSAEEKFVAVGEVMLFDGFLKVYLESKDDEDHSDSIEGVVPAVEVGKNLIPKQIEAVERFSQPPFRYAEASLVRKLEELGIGRPSTYAPIISTIQKRQYVVKSDKEGIERSFNVLTLKDAKIIKTNKKETIGFEKNKLCPTDIGIVVNDFLVNHFQFILNYDFTAKVEKQFDDIAHGKIVWKKMIRDFYSIFHESVTTTMTTSEKVRGERLLGQDPKTGKNMYAKLARFGAVIQIGESNTEDKLQFAKLLPNQSIETITYEEALDLFKLPRVVGHHNDSEVVVNIGRFGPYIHFEDKFYSIAKGEDLMTITLDRCFEIIKAKQENDAQKAPVVLGLFQGAEVSVAVGRYGPYVAYNKHFFSLPNGTNIKEVSLEEAIENIKRIEEKNNIKTFEQDPDLKVLKGRYGPYISKGANNYKIPKGVIANELSYEQCLSIVEQESQKEGKTKRAKKATTKKTTSKTSAKKTTKKTVSKTDKKK